MTAATMLPTTPNSNAGPNEPHQMTATSMTVSASCSIADLCQERLA